jgi:hypothetical protein
MRGLGTLPCVASLGLALVVMILMANKRISPGASILP